MIIVRVWNKLERTVRQKGALGLLRVGLNAARVAVLRNSPARRRARAESRAFDREHGVDTAGTAAVDPSLPNAEFAVRYQPSGREELERILTTLALDERRFTFVDVGSGKGRVLFYASDRPFVRIVGIEFAPALHAVAEKNARVYRSPTQKCHAIEPRLGDATTTPLPAGPLVVYMYNPFARPVMQRFAEHLRQSLADEPRELWLLYLNPIERGCFDGAAWLDKVHEGDDWIVWRAR